MTAIVETDTSGTIPALPVPTRVMKIRVLLIRFAGRMTGTDTHATAKTDISGVSTRNNALILAI